MTDKLKKHIRNGVLACLFSLGTIAFIFGYPVQAEDVNTALFLVFVIVSMVALFLVAAFSTLGPVISYYANKKLKELQDAKN